MISRRSFGCAAFVLLASSAHASQYPTIVGSWYQQQYGPTDCQSHVGLHIKPMSLLNDETVCEFDDVSRSGWKVTWHGTCGFSGDFEDNVKVTAIENSGVLSIQFNDGAVAGGFMRCPADR